MIEEIDKEKRQSVYFDTKFCNLYLSEKEENKLENDVTLKKYFPGIFEKIIAALLDRGYEIFAYKDAEHLIYEINDLLSLLRSAPGGRIDVPADLELKREDFFCWDIPDDAF